MASDPNLGYFRARQLARDAIVHAKIDATRDAPTTTLDGLRELVATAEASGEALIEIVVHRTKTTRPSQPIALMVLVGDTLRRGPLSSEDREVEHAGGHNWRARWRTRDCKMFCERMKRHG